jgi:hypothetical protein
VRNPERQLLKWGPRFPGWDRSRQPKAVGRPVEVGSRGVIRESLRVSDGRYRVVIHWDPERAGGPYWSTAIGPGELKVTAASLRSSQLVGSWREVGRSARIEFLPDGGFAAVDNEGMAVAGRFRLVGDGRLSFAIRHEGSADEIVDLDFSLIGDELTFAPAAGGRAERYRKLK